MTTRVWRAIIADDEPLARQVIRDLLAGEADVTVVGEARTGLEAVELIGAAGTDLLFLDVDMPDLGGFGVLDAIPVSERPHTVFVTAYDEFAVRAFEEEAVDYLVKPFSDERFRKTLARVRRHLARIESVASAAGGPSSSGAASSLERLPVTLGRRTRWIDVAAVRWIEADDYYVRLHTEDGVHLVRIPLTTLERRLDASVFVRVHRNALVNRAAVGSLTRDRSGAHAVVLVTGERIVVSERRVRAVSDLLASGTRTASR